MAPEWSSDAAGGLHEANVNGHPVTGGGGSMVRASGRSGSGPAGRAHQLLKEESVFFRGEPYDRLPIPQWLVLQPWTYREY